MWYSKNRSKGALRAHLILVTRYRRTLISASIAEIIRLSIENLSSEKGFYIEALEFEHGNHVHILVRYPPRMAVSQIVGAIKYRSTVDAWASEPAHLRKFIWRSRQIWTNGFFACSTGDVSTAKILDYIANHG